MHPFDAHIAQTFPSVGTFVSYFSSLPLPRAAFEYNLCNDTPDQMEVHYIFLGNSRATEHIYTFGDERIEKIHTLKKQLRTKMLRRYVAGTNFLTNEQKAKLYFLIDHFPQLWLGMDFFTPRLTLYIQFPYYGYLRANEYRACQQKIRELCDTLRIDFPSQILDIEQINDPLYLGIRLMGIDCFAHGHERVKIYHEFTTDHPIIDTIRIPKFYILRILIMQSANGRKKYYFELNHTTMEAILPYVSDAFHRTLRFDPRDAKMVYYSYENGREGLYFRSFDEEASSNSHIR